jgi:glycosyltransferase involved in cell wall biosynthesis
MAPAIPSISIIVPNYNGGATIDATLRSLIDQHYPRLEILVVDGASTDNSVDVIRRYEPHIAWWTSEKDSGQSNAINKGFARATGEIVNWLCSDDLLLPGALHTIARTFVENPSADVVVGSSKVTYPDPRLNRTAIASPLSVELLPSANQIPQPACFYRRTLLVRDPPLDETLHYAMDLELWTHFVASGARWHFVPDVLSEMRFSEANKTAVGGVRITREIETIYKRYVKERVPLTFWHRLLRYPLERVRHRHRGRLFGLVFYPYQSAIILLLAPFYGFRRVRWMTWTDLG